MTRQSRTALELMSVFCPCDTGLPGALSVVTACSNRFMEVVVVGLVVVVLVVVLVVVVVLVMVPACGGGWRETDRGWWCRPSLW